MRLSRYFVLFTLVSSCFCMPAFSADGLQVGAARRDITPPAGSSHYRGKSSGAHDPLYARALVMRQGEEKAALVICDLSGISRDLSVVARRRISQETGIPYANISMTGTHTHAGPRYQDAVAEYVKKRPRASEGGDEGYGAQLIEQIVAAAVDASKAARPAQLQTAVAKQEGLSFNRRFLMKNGQVRFNPGLQNPEIVRAMGPIDPQVGIVMFRDTGGQPLASLTVFALHLDTVGGNQYSADYPMYLSEALMKQFGSGFISFFGTGTCGNLNHLDVKRPGPQRGHDGATRDIGQTLTKTVTGAIGRMAKTGPGSLRVRSETVFAPLQSYTEAELAWAEGSEPNSVYPGREFLQQRRRMKILSLKSLRENEAIPPSVSGGDWTLPVEVHTFRLSADTAVVTLPGEIFVELGLDLKKRSPFPNTFVIELANASISYVPNREAFAQGDYEIINSRLQPGGGELMVEAALKILHELRN